MKKIALVIGIVLTLVIVILVAAALTIKPDRIINQHKDQIAQFVTKTLGREVKLGQVRSFFWPTFGAEIRDISLAGPAGVSQPQVQLGSIEVKVDLFKALFSWGKQLEVKFLSNAYFELLKARPELKAAFALGDRVVVQVARGKSIIVGPDGEEDAARVQAFLK